MKLIVDGRESALAAALQANGTPFELDTLALGDVTLVNDDNDTVLVVERKTWQDLASSISDGRYSEQSARLHATELDNHQIVYIIEGNIRSYTQRGHVSKEALRSAVVSLNYYKGFSVMQAVSTSDTAQILADFLRKISKDAAAGRIPSTHGQQDSKCESYSQLQQRGKRKVHPTEIEAAMLSQIPGINTTMATNVLSSTAFRELIESKGAAAEGINYTTSTGKTRKVPVSVIESLKEYLANV